MYKRLVISLLLLASFFIPQWGAKAAQLPSDETPQRISFARGRRKAVIRGHWVRGTTQTWLVRARAGQTMTVSIKSIPKIDNEGKVMPETKNDATFDVITPAGKSLEAKGSLWKARLTETGDYSIEVLGDHGNTEYILTVGIR